MNKEIKSLLLALLPKGHQNPVAGRVIDETLDLKERERKLVIEQLRNDGILVLADENGYYLASNIEEIKKFVAKVNKRVKSEIRTIQTAKAVIKEAETRGAGQLSLPLDDMMDKLFGA
ncbi:hypothetical protein [Butyrivibrio sp. AD3002]|uniref:hypothetical protein n=1 Tax=Butyrivibrio sp. AD3002 TaxID=1280670 RepID=UPI0003B5C90E|nr:hypothetical protein [Butyrivibrio sp. AD3002]